MKIHSVKITTEEENPYFEKDSWSAQPESDGEVIYQ